MPYIVRENLRSESTCQRIQMTTIEGLRLRTRKTQTRRGCCQYLEEANAVDLLLRYPKLPTKSGKFLRSQILRRRTRQMRVTQIQGTNDRARSSVSKNTTHRAHGTLPRSSTQGSSALGHIDNQRTPSSNGPELGESYHSQMAPSTSQPSSSAPTPARSGQAHLAAKPRVEIFVIAACRIQKWPGGSIKDKELDTIFDEVSALISRNNIQSIKFKLEPLNQKETPLEYFIERSEKEAFELVIQRFAQRREERRKAGEARFTISLEPVFERQGAAEAEAAQASQSDEDIW